jgi:hypothetical protein
MSNQTTEQFEAIVKKYRESALDKCPENELRQYHTFLLEHGAVGGFNETTYYQLLGYMEKLLIVKNQENQEEHDAMMRAFHGVPLANKLETMPDIDLAELQSHLASNSPGNIIIENEWQRRDLSKPPSNTPKITTKPLTTIQKIKHWYQGNQVELIPIKNGDFVDVYARYEKSTSSRVANGLVNFWLTNWKILLPVIVSIIGIIVAAGVSLYIHFDSKPKGEPTQKNREAPKQMRTDIRQPLMVHSQSTSNRAVARHKR